MDGSVKIKCICKQHKIKITIWSIKDQENKVDKLKNKLQTTIHQEFFIHIRNDIDKIYRQHFEYTKRIQVKKLNKLINKTSNQVTDCNRITRL